MQASGSSGSDFAAKQCGRCCYTPGAGLYLDKEDFERIAGRVGKKKLKALCRYEKALQAWVLRQPCPFYDQDKGCTIYEIRPLTCTKYPLHPPLQEMPNNLAVDAFCPAARASGQGYLRLVDHLREQLGSNTSKIGTRSEQKALMIPMHFF